MRVLPDLIKNYNNTEKYVCTIQKMIKKLNTFEIFKLMNEKHQLTVDVHMFTAKLYPLKPRCRHTGSVSRTKIHHEHKRIEELLILRHRINKKIARFSNDIILYLYHRNPDKILPKSQLSW